MPTIGYHADYGWGGGYNQYGNTSMYYPTYNYSAPEQAGLRAEQAARGKYIDNTSSALNHYLFGDGTSVYIGDNTLNALINSDKFQTIHSSFVSGVNENHKGTFSVDMTNTVFHIGRTNVEYNLELINGQTKLTYNVFVNDGF